MTEQAIANDRDVEPLHISEASFRSLPRSVRMLILAYAKPAASCQDGLMVLEMRPYRWPEIEAEIKATARTPARQQFRRTVRYANDYECRRDGAAWSLVGCASARRERCPICHRKMKPITIEKYLIIEPIPRLSGLWSRLRSRLRIS